MEINIRLKKDEFGIKRFFATGEDKDFKCSQCRKNISTGFMCENNEELILCEDCQNEFKMIKCKHDKRGEHRHLLFQREKNGED